MKTKRTATKQERGRPRSFDTERALDAALHVFWQKGYEGTTLPDLTEAMGINRPSLYAAFGNKESLFKKVLERYSSGPACHVKKAVGAKTGRAVFEQLLAGAIDLMTSPENPGGGCLVVQGALACGDDAVAAKKQLVAIRAEGEALLRKRLERAKAEGDFPSGANPADLARYAATVVHGIAVQGTSGATKKELRAVAKLALTAWPAIR